MSRQRACGSKEKVPIKKKREGADAGNGKSEGEWRHVEEKKWQCEFFLPYCLTTTAAAVAAASAAAALIFLTR